MVEMPDKVMQREFLYSLLGFLDNRRIAIDTRSSVILAASSLALGVFLLQLKPNEFFYYNCSLVYKIFTIIIILSFLISCGLSLFLIVPIVRARKIQKEKTKSLSWFYLIAEEKPDEYYQDISILSEEKILKELSKQVVEVSRILRKRYIRLLYACYCLYLGIVFLLIYTILMILK